VDRIRSKSAISFDDVARLPLAKNKFGRILVSVKGGKNLDGCMARDLLGAVVGGRIVCRYVESLAR